MKNNVIAFIATGTGMFLIQYDDGSRSIQHHEFGEEVIADKYIKSIEFIRECSNEDFKSMDENAVIQLFAAYPPHEDE